MAKVDISKLKPDGETFGATTVVSPYVNDSDRFVVTFSISYPFSDEITDVEEAAAYALAFTRDSKSDDAMWTVLDRETDRLFLIEQREFEPLIDDRDMLR